jgi:hypothetical protein
MEVDFETRRRKQRELIMQLVERKVRSRAQQLYDERGQGDGLALQDWVKAESEIVGNSTVAPLYRRFKSDSDAAKRDESANISADKTSTCESPA